MVKHRCISCLLYAATFVLGFGTSLGPSAFVYADGEQNQNTDVVIVTTADELNDALYFGGNYKLGADINTGDCQYGTPVYAMHDTVLDLDDYTVTLPDANASFYTYGASLTIKGDQGRIVKAVENTNLPTIYVYDGDIVFDGGNIEGKKFPVLVKAGNQFTMNGGSITGSQYGISNHGILTITGGTINSSDIGIVGYETSETTISGGTINADHIAVSGSGTHTGTKFNISGGTINANLGVYLPQKDGETVISGGTINGNVAGVEVRAGSLSISGGSFNVPKDVVYDVIPNGSGSTTSGAAVAVAQHTTRNPISVTISGGSFSAANAFSEADPQDGDADSVSAVITGGTFDGGIVAEDLVDFIDGGLFVNEPDEDDVKEGESVYRTSEGYLVVDDEELANQNLEYADETGDGIYELMPIKVDWDGHFMEDCEDGHICGWVEFNKEFIADRLADVSMIEIDSSSLKLDSSKENGKLIGAMDLKIVDRNGARIPVEDNDVDVTLEIDEDTYNELSSYDELYVVFFDDDGNEAERVEAKLEAETDYGISWYYLTFKITHMSTYGVLGVNHAEAPETGVITNVSGSGSATNMSGFTAVLVGISTSVLSFIYLMNRRKQGQR